MCIIMLEWSLVRIFVESFCQVRIFSSQNGQNVYDSLVVVGVINYVLETNLAFLWVKCHFVPLVLMVM